MRDRTTIINGVEYSENNDEYVFLVPYTDLGNFSSKELPNNSSMHVTELGSFDDFEIYFSVTNGNSPGNTDYHSIFILFSKISNDYINASREVNEIANAIYKFSRKGYMDNPKIQIEPKENDAWETILTYYMQSKDVGDFVIRELVNELIEKVRNRKPTPKVFLCHSSSDKELVEKFAKRLKLIGSHVWFDKWEIKTGDSIVEKINEGLGSMTHLAIFLSKESVDKPWVQKELSTALMKKLSDNSVKILPLKVDDTKIPYIIFDLKYADCSLDIESGFNQVIMDILE